MKGSIFHKLDKLFLGSTKTKLTEIRVGYGTEFARVAIYCLVGGNARRTATYIDKA
jgi:hypothetical protein